MADLAQLSIRVDALEVRTATADMNRMTASAGSLSGMIAKLGVGVGLGLLARQFYDVNVEFQRLGAILETVEGSSRNAALAFKMLEKFATETPFQLQEVVQGFTQLRARGLDATATSLKAYGDLASAFGKDLGTAIQAVGNATTGEMEMLKQFGIVSHQTGDKVKFTFRGVAETVGRDARSIENYLRRLAQQNFGGAMEKQMQTLGGAVSNLQDSFGALLRAAGAAGGGDVMVGVVKDLTEWLGRAKQGMEALGSDQAFQGLVVEVGNLLESSKDLLRIFSEIGGAAGEAGVKTGAFARVLQGVQLLTKGIESIIQGYIVMWEKIGVAVINNLILPFERFGLKAAAAMRAVGLEKMADNLEASFASAKKLGTALDTDATKRIIDFGDSWDGMLDRFESTETRATQRVENFKKSLKAGLGDTSDVGKQKTAPQPAVDAEAMKRLVAAQDAYLKGLHAEVAMLGLTTQQQDLYKLSVMGLTGAKLKAAEADLAKKFAFEEEQQASAWRMQNAETEKQELEEITKWNRQVIETRQQNAQAIRDSIDPMARFRRELEQINALEGQKGGLSTIEADAARLQITKEQEKAFIDLQIKGSSTAQTIADAWGTTVNGMEDAFVRFATTGKASFKEMTQSILADLARMMAQKAFQQLLQFGINAYFGSSMSSTASTNGLSDPMGPTGNIDMTGVGSGTMANPGGGAAAATRPAGGGEAAAGDVSVVVNVSSSGTEVQGDDKSARDLGAKIGNMVRGVILDEKRPGGLLYGGAH